MASDDEVIWATSTTGDDFQCVHVDDWRQAKARIEALEAALRDHAAEIDKALAAEREACAKIATAEADYSWEPSHQSIAQHIADAIRARNET